MASLILPCDIAKEELLYPRKLYVPYLLASGYTQERDRTTPTSRFFTDVIYSAVSTFEFGPHRI